MVLLFNFDTFALFNSNVQTIHFRNSLHGRLSIRVTYRRCKNLFNGHQRDGRSLTMVRHEQARTCCIMCRYVFIAISRNHARSCSFDIHSRGNCTVVGTGDARSLQHKVEPFGATVANLPMSLNLFLF